MAIPRPDSHDATHSPGHWHGGDTNTTVLTPAADGTVRLPDATLVADGQFVRIGDDLVVNHPSGGSVVVEGYFDAENPPELVSPDGTQILSPGLVQSFLQPLAPGQYAQMGSAPAASPIGQVEELSGEAFAIRADGSRVQLAKGDAVYQGDIVETSGDSSAIRMVFVDKTMFALGSDAKLALDELVFSPETLSGSVQFSMLKGVFIFSSGQIAKTDNTDMTVVTPVATIGIRGTEVAGRVDDQGGSQFTVIDGAIEVITQAGSVTLDSQGETTLVAGMSTPPSDPIVLSPAELGQAYSELAGVAPNFLGYGQQQPGPDDGVSPDEQDRSELDDGESGSTGQTNASSSSDTLLASNLPVEGQSTPGVTTGLPNPGSEPLEPVTIVTPVPGIDLATNLTFEGTEGSSEGGTAQGNEPPAESLLAFGPLDPGAGGEPTGSQSSEDTGLLPVSFQLGTEDGVVGEGGSTETGSPDSPLDFGSGSSPFRGGSSATDPIGSNPYLSEPFGSSIPGTEGTSTDSGASAPVGDSGGGGSEFDDDPVPTNAPQEVVPEPDLVTASDGETVTAGLTLTVSNATKDGKFQDLTDSYVLPELGLDSFVLVGGAEMQIGGVNAGAEVALQRDAFGDVEITLNSAWNSVKNLLAESDGAANIDIDNFVHADVNLGDGGDSHVTIVDAKRGFVSTGDGNDSISIDAKTNGGTWSEQFDVSTGAGNDVVIFDGAPTGTTALAFDGGAGVDTLQLIGPGDSFDLSSSMFQLSNIERIDISGASDVTLAIKPNAIPLTGGAINELVGTAETLVVDGDAGDTIDFVSEAWHQVGTENIEGEGYAIYEHSSGARVVADVDIALA